MSGATGKAWIALLAAGAAALAAGAIVVNYVLLGVAGRNDPVGKLSPRAVLVTPTVTAPAVTAPAATSVNDHRGGRSGEPDD